MNILEEFQKWQDERVSRRIVERLFTFPKDRWVQFDWIFNQWDFPIEFYDLIPRGYNSYTMKRKYRVIEKVCDVFRENVSWEVQLRFHNVVMNKRMTDKEFDYWFSLRFDDEKDNKNSIYFERKKQFENIEFWKDDVYERLQSNQLTT